MVNSSGLPTYDNSFSLDLEDLLELTIDDTYQRLYTANDGAVDVTDLVAGTTSNWVGNSANCQAIALLPSSNFVYGGTTQDILRYNRANGTPVADFSIATGNAQLMPRGMAISANGRIVYATSNFTGNQNQGFAGYLYQLGIIGYSSLTIGSTTPAPTIYSGIDQTIHLSESATLNAFPSGSTSNLPVTWSVVSGPSGASFSSTSGSTVTASFSDRSKASCANAYCCIWSRI